MQLCDTMVVPEAARAPARIGALCLALVGIGMIGGGCGSPSKAPGTALLTLGSLRASYLAAPEDPLGAGLSSVFPAGFAPAYFLASKDEIRIASAFNEGHPTAYISTDIWINFPEVWAQPLYLFVSAFDGADPVAHALPLPWVMSVGPASGFWSPYFKVTYVEVLPDTPPDRYRTVRDILDAHLPLHPGPTRLLTALPDPAMAPEDPTRVLLPALRAPGKIGLPITRPIWIDGKAELQAGLDFGPDRFEVDAGDAIVEAPLFFFFHKDDAGAWVPIPTVPRVGGTGPLFARRPPMAPGNRPRYGAFWRLWAVHLPPSARVFVPRARDLEWQTRTANETPTLPIAVAPAAIDPGDPLPGLDAYAFRVLFNDGCLASATKIEDLAACPWLDSQAALERFLPQALWPSEIVVTCPFVAYAGEAVPPAGP